MFSRRVETSSTTHHPPPPPSIPAACVAFPLHSPTIAQGPRVGNGRSPAPKKPNTRSDSFIVMPKVPNNHRKELARNLATYKEIVDRVHFNFFADPHSFARAVWCALGLRNGWHSVPTCRKTPYLPPPPPGGGYTYANLRGRGRSLSPLPRSPIRKATSLSSCPRPQTITAKSSLSISKPTKKSSS